MSSSNLFPFLELLDVVFDMSQHIAKPLIWSKSLLIQLGTPKIKGELVAMELTIKMLCH